MSTAISNDAVARLTMFHPHAVAISDLLDEKLALERGKKSPGILATKARRAKNAERNAAADRRIAEIEIALQPHGRAYHQLGGQGLLPPKYGSNPEAIVKIISAIRRGYGRDAHEVLAFIEKQKRDVADMKRQMR